MAEIEHDCPALREFMNREGMQRVTHKCSKCGKFWTWDPTNGEWKLRG